MKLTELAKHYQNASIFGEAEIEGIFLRVKKEQKTGFSFATKRTKKR